MKRPVIGITTDTSDKPDQYESPMAYAQSVQKAGGLPLLLAYGMDLAWVPQLLDMLDGVLFSGGNDLDPAAYGQSYHPKAVPVDPARQKFEMALIAEVERRRMPTLGICMGCQLMNVYRGGSLIQFLPDQARPQMIEHRKVNNQWTRHEVNVEPQSTVAKVVGKTSFNANSSHKQAVANLGRGLQKIGLSPDGIIEGVEDPTMPLFLGVQWHPERLSDEPEHLALFKLLVEKAAHRRG